MPKRAEYGINWYNWRGTYKVYRWGGLGEETTRIAPDSVEWFSLLDEIGSFSFKGKGGQFTVRKELRKNIPYWYGFKRTDTGTKKVYIGKTEELVVEKLEEAVKTLVERIRG